MLLDSKKLYKILQGPKIIDFLEKKEYFILCTWVHQSNWKVPFLEKIRFKTQGLMIKFFSLHEKSNSHKLESFFLGRYTNQKF
jgi:hypothetical protein